MEESDLISYLRKESKEINKYNIQNGTINYKNIDYSDKIFKINKIKKYETNHTKKDLSKNEHSENNINNKNININKIRIYNNKNEKLKKDTNKRGEDNNNFNNYQIENVMYINEKLYPLVRDHLNITPNNLRIIDVIGDGNCLYRSISRFIYRTEDLFHRVRQEIYQEARRRENNYPDLTLDTEEGPLNIHRYINKIQSDRFFGGELEISIEILYIILI